MGEGALPDRFSIRWTPADAPRKVIFERRATGGWTRIEKRWTGDVWAYAGSEIVANLEVEGGLPATESYTGP